jgi:C-terminal processing protease CtpA/Prc
MPLFARKFAACSHARFLHDAFVLSNSVFHSRQVSNSFDGSIERTARHGRIATLVNGWTAGAGEMVAEFANRTRYATVVGEKTTGQLAALQLDAPQRPAQLAQRDDLFLLLFAQDIAHVDGG